ncbi:MAG: hypothetical protein S4CHLAM7_02960 [Chlamydiae bacterium]|nr:hypothetical protein [Chlamydiota bacterium]
MKTSLRLFSVILSILVSFSLNAEMHTSSREGDPAAFVENVNVVHGDYSELEVDLDVAGPDRLLFTRYYSSQNQVISSDFGGWFLRPQRIFKVDQENGDSYSTHEGEFKLTHVYVGTKEGSILKFTGWQNNENPAVASTLQIDSEEECLGIANTARGKPSAWTNIKNYKLIFYPDKNLYELLLADGRKNIFSYNEAIQGF